jgi:hypothetical protein
MPRLTIELTEQTKQIAEARASESGHATVDAYLEALIRSDAETDYGAPSDLMVGSNEQLLALLDEAEASPESEMTDAEWAEMCRRAMQRGGANRGK